MNNIKLGKDILPTRFVDNDGSNRIRTGSITSRHLVSYVPNLKDEMSKRINHRINFAIGMGIYNSVRCSETPISPEEEQAIKAREARQEIEALIEERRLANRSFIEKSVDYLKDIIDESLLVLLKS